MAQTKQCPACGEAVPHEAAQCPHCRLDGLDRVFLSREDYLNWVDTVLKPHAGRRFHRVMTGGGATLLILTGSGELYGMGRNYSGQIREDADVIIPEPLHMASGVVSAAISGYYSIWATTDGRIHIRGRGEFSTRVPEFTDAREVFISDGAFFVVDRRGRVFCFGDNRNGLLEPQREEELAVFPEMSSTQGPFYDVKIPLNYTSRLPSDRDAAAAEREVRRKIEETDEYRACAARFEQGDLVIRLNHLSTTCSDPEYLDLNCCKKWEQTYHYIPSLVWRNNCIYTPVLYHDQAFADTPHRYRSRPLEPADRTLFDPDPQIKKICTECHRSKKAAVALSCDGALTWFDYKEMPHRLDWSKAPVHDIALGPYADNITLSCRDGSVYILDTYPLPEVRITKEITLDPPR